MCFACSKRKPPLRNDSFDLSRKPKNERTLTEQILATIKPSADRSALCAFSLYAQNPYLTTARQILNAPATSPVDQNRAVAALLGLAIGDSQGAPYEFLPWQPELLTKTYNPFHLLAGQWTDDTAMALCLADTLSSGLVCFDDEEGQEPVHLDQNQLMGVFRLWWRYGYNNAFRNEPKGSVGLGGNISSSFGAPHSPEYHGRYETEAGDIRISGNGAAMRNSPVAIIATSVEEAMRLAWEQSKVTHKGVESALCCQILAFLTYHLIHSDKATVTERLTTTFELLDQFEFSPQVAEAAGDVFILSVMKLVRGEDEWNWRNDGFRFNEDRFKQKPGYIGSYVMDGLAMALHCLATTSSFEECIKKAACRGGDADSMGAIAGQLAGPLYGLENFPRDWIDQVLLHDGNGEIACRALVLMNLRRI